MHRLKPGWRSQNIFWRDKALLEEFEGTADVISSVFGMRFFTISTDNMLHHFN